MEKQITNALKQATDFHSIGKYLKANGLDYSFHGAGPLISYSIYTVGDYYIAPKEYASKKDIVVKNWAFGK